MTLFPIPENVTVTADYCIQLVAALSNVAACLFVEEKCCEWLVARRKERAAVSQEICNANCEEDKEGGTWAYFEHFLRAFCTDMCPFVTEKWFS